MKLRLAQVHVKGMLTVAMSINGISSSSSYSDSESLSSEELSEPVEGDLAP